MIRYKNGNAEVVLETNGTRTITFPESGLKLEFPLNIDIRVQTFCPFGLNQKTGKAVCSFCHESANTVGLEADYEKLKDLLLEIPAGTELAIGCNQYTSGLDSFLGWARDKGYVCNLTVNQLFLSSPKYKKKILDSISESKIKGLGISHRGNMTKDSYIDYENTVVHVIAGIDSVEEVLKLKDIGVTKVLVLGEKDFGFNSGKVELKSDCHKQWYRNILKVIKAFAVVSFDNLALEQLNVKRFLYKNYWESFYQGEHSFYINAVDQYFSPSSRSGLKKGYKSIKEYFNEIDNQKERV